MKDQTATSAKRKPYDFDARKPQNLRARGYGAGIKMDGRKRVVADTRGVTPEAAAGSRS